MAFSDDSMSKETLRLRAGGRPLSLMKFEDTIIKTYKQPPPNLEECKQPLTMHRVIPDVPLQLSEADEARNKAAYYWKLKEENLPWCLQDKGGKHSFQGTQVQKEQKYVAFIINEEMTHSGETRKVMDVVPIGSSFDFRKKVFTKSVVLDDRFVDQVNNQIKKMHKDPRWEQKQKQIEVRNGDVPKEDQWYHPATGEILTGEAAGKAKKKFEAAERAAARGADVGGDDEEEGGEGKRGGVKGDHNPDVDEAVPDLADDGFVDNAGDDGQTFGVGDGDNDFGDAGEYPQANDEEQHEEAHPEEITALFRSAMLEEEGASSSDDDEEEEKGKGKERDEEPMEIDGDTSAEPVQPKLFTDKDMVPKAPDVVNRIEGLLSADGPTGGTKRKLEPDAVSPPLEERPRKIPKVAPSEADALENTVITVEMFTKIFLANGAQIQASHVATKLIEPIKARVGKKAFKEAGGVLQVQKLVGICCVLGEKSGEKVLFLRPEHIPGHGP